MKTAKANNKKRAEGIRILLDAAAYLQSSRGYYSPADRRAVKLLLTLSAKVLGNAIYMKHGLRIDRDRETGHLTVLGESNYYATNDGKLVRHDPEVASLRDLGFFRREGL